MEMTTLYVVFLKPGPNWTANITPELEHVLLNHRDYLLDLQDKDEAYAAGPFTDRELSPTIRGMTLLNTDSLEQAQAWVEADPAVQTGHFAAEIHQWVVPTGRGSLTR